MSSDNSGALSLDDVRRIALLSRLAIRAREAEQALEQLNGIFALVEQIRSVDTRGIEPMSHPLGGSQRLRDDTVTEPHGTEADGTESGARAANMRNAPAQQDGLFLVPRVVE